MGARRMSTYSEARWGMPTTGEVLIRKDQQGGFYVDDVPVVHVRVVDLFSVLMGADGVIHIVLTGFLRLVNYQDAPDEGHSGSASGH